MKSYFKKVDEKQEDFGCNEYTLEELQTATYNFAFVHWFNVPENKDKIYEYIMSNREKSTQYWNSVSKTINDANIELKRINGSQLF